MLPRKRIWMPLAALLLIGAPVAVLSRGPDFDLQMTREVPSPTEATKLAGFVEDQTQWPRWFHLTTEAVALDDGLVRLTVDPNKGEWKKFTLDLRVVSNQPRESGGRNLAIEFVDDSKKKLRRMFADLRWEIEVFPSAAAKGPDGIPELATVRGTVHARTASWRSRLFGRISPRILLNQALYPDLIGLAEIEKGKPEPALRIGM